MEIACNPPSQVMETETSLEAASWRAWGILYVIAASLVCYLAPLPELVRSLLALPAVVILPQQLGRLLLKIAHRWRPGLFASPSPLVRGVICWWAGLGILSALANAFQHLGLWAAIKFLPWLTLGILAASVVYDLTRGKGRTRPGWGAVLKALRREWPALAAVLLGLPPLWLHKRAFPFPVFMRNSFTLANMVYQPVVRLLRDGYLTFEPSHKAGSYLLVFIPSALSNVDPLSMAWSLPILQVAAFALGLYLWAYEVSRSRLLATLIPLFGGFVLSAGLLFETSVVVFRSNSVQLALLPWMLWVLQRYADEKPSGKGLAVPMLLSALGFVGWFAVVHSDKLFWPGRLQALYPGEDLVRLLHLYGVEWSARTTAIAGWLALPLLFVARAILGRRHPHRDLLSLFFLLTAFQFQLHAWEALIFLGCAWAYLGAAYLLKQRASHPFVYALLAGLWMFWLLQWAGVIRYSSTNPLFNLFFFWMSASPASSRVIDMVELLRNAHAPLTLGLWALGTIGMSLRRRRAGLLITTMATLCLFVYFLPEPNGVRAYKVLLPFAAYALAWIVTQTYQWIAGWPRRTARSVALVALASAMIYVSWGLVEPFQQYYSRSQPGQRYASYMAEEEMLALSWLSENLPENARLISDPHSTHLFSELTNSIDPLEHAMTTTEMSSVGQRQVREIKEGVFAAENSQAAYRALQAVGEYELSYRNRDYAQKTGRTSDPTLLVVLSGKTSQWISSSEIDAIYDPVSEPIDPVHLAPFADLRYFRLRYQVDDHLAIYEARRLDPPGEDTALYWVAQGNDRWFGGQQEQALALYQKALQIDPREPSAYVALAESYRQEGDWEAAIQMLERAIRYAPNDTDLYRVLGEIYLVHDEPEEAISSYQRAIELAPDNPALRARLGDAYLVQGNEVAASQAYALSAQSPYGEAESLVALGKLYAEKGLLGRAEQAYREALDLDPRLAIAHQGLARLYDAEGQTAQAKDRYKRLTDLDPYQALWYAELRRIYLKEGRPEAAIALYEDAVKRHRGEKELYLALGALYQNQARQQPSTSSEAWMEKSIAALRRAHALDAHHEGVQYLLSQAYQAKGQTEKAIRMLQRTGRNYPHLAWPDRLLGELYKSQGDWRGAITAYQSAIAADPSQVWPYLALGSALAETETVERAAAVYQSAAEANPTSALPYLALAEMADRQGEEARSIEYYRQALDRDPEATLAQLGAAYPDRLALIEVCERLIALSPENAHLSAFVGDLYLAEGQADQARTRYAAALRSSLDPELHVQLGDSYRQDKEWDAARRQYGLARQAAPWSTRPLARLAETRGEIYLDQGRLDRALVFYRLAQRLVADARSHAQEQGDDLDGYTAHRFYDEDNAALDGTSVKRTLFYIDNRPQRTLFQHPTSRIEYRVQVPPAAQFAASLALAPEVWQAEKGDGVQFEVYVTDQGTHYRVFSQYIDPKLVPSDRRWHDCSVDLAPWAGHTVTLALVTTPGPNNDARYDWAGWGEPRLTQAAQYDFLAEFNQADVDADPLAVYRTEMTIGEDSRPILFQDPPARVVYPQVPVVDHSTLTFGIGIDPNAWSPELGDGIEFQVWVRDRSGNEVQVYGAYIDPKHNPDQRGWIDAQVDLDRFAGQAVEIQFVTLPGPAGDDRYDWGGWATPVLIKARPAVGGDRERD